jgi:hypothetical protein
MRIRIRNPGEKEDKEKERAGEVADNTVMGRGRVEPNTNDSKKLGLLFYSYSVGLALILFVSNMCYQCFLHMITTESAGR